MSKQKPVVEAQGDSLMSTPRDYAGEYKRRFKRRELEHELRHETEPSYTRRAPEPHDPHDVHINGKKWKTFGTKSHATNVARKIQGATVHKANEEVVHEQTMNKSSGMPKHPALDAFHKATRRNMSYGDIHKHLGDEEAKKHIAALSKEREDLYASHGFKAHISHDHIIRGLRASFAADAAKKAKNEEVQHIDELSQERLQAYKSAARKRIYSLQQPDGTPRKGKEAEHAKRVAGYRTAWRKQEEQVASTEEADQLDELKKGTLMRYVSKATKSSIEHGVKASNARDHDNMAMWAAHANKRDQRDASIRKAQARLTAPKAKMEEVEQVDEIKASTAASYTAKVVDPVYGMPRSNKKLPQRLKGLERAHARMMGRRATSAEEVQPVTMHRFKAFTEDRKSTRLNSSHT